MEVIKKVEGREEFKEWYCNAYPDNRRVIDQGTGIYYDIWHAMPDTAKLALICEWLREEKEYFIEIEKDYFTGEFNVTTTGFKKCYYDCDETYNEAMATGIWIALKLIDKAQ